MNKRHYEHTLPNIRGSLSNTYASGKAKKAATGKRKGKKKGSAANNEPQENQEALKWKRLALTKKKKLRIKIPQRQFIGESRELSEKIDRKMENEIRNILNL